MDVAAVEAALSAWVLARRTAVRAETAAGPQGAGQSCVADLFAAECIPRAWGGTDRQALGVLHLTALVGAVVLVVAPGPGVAVPVAWVSAVLYALGFVALLDLLARYPRDQQSTAVVVIQELTRIVRTTNDRQHCRPHPSIY